ncbi:MAG: hypothetical protein A3F40_02105 [Chlamydiae bacterium RIFCSPHIGHO2_12_FULL_27_8]|nr:MAG: hypothetical protein A3F40_02105 [Chlamydiae bacterium RIFCSPHIGHO2_12_FULL_27_8]OGN65854.1 MAG: hypothetical protein A2888_03370 [Chlamydiae bacterium RIFCSPLOWO2_01_FULL_28_7]
MTDKIDFVSDISEEQKSRKVIGMYRAYLNRLDDIEIKEPKINPIFTGVKIDKAETAKTINKEPILKSEKTTALGFEVAKAIEENDLIIRDLASIVLRNLKKDNDKMLKISEEEKILLEKHIDALSQKYSYDVVKSILNIVGASSAIIAGTLIAPQAAAGYLLVVGGLSNILGQEILPIVNGYEYIASFFTSDKETQQNAAGYMQAITAMSSAVLSLAASFSAYPLLSNLFQQSSMLKIVETSVVTASSIGSAVSSYSKKEDMDMKTERIETEKKEKEVDYEFEMHKNNLKNVMKLSESFLESSRDAVNILLKANQKSNQSLKAESEVPSVMNLQFALAKAGVKAMESNSKILEYKNDQRFKMVEKILYESYEDWGSKQKWQSFYPGTAMFTTLACTVMSLALEGKADKLVSVFNELSKHSSLVSDGMIKYSDGDITKVSGKVRSEENERDNFERSKANSSEKINQIAQAIMDAVRSLR